MCVTHANHPNFVLWNFWIRWFHCDFDHTLCFRYFSPCCRWIICEIMHFERHLICTRRALSTKNSAKTIGFHRQMRVPCCLLLVFDEGLFSFLLFISVCRTISLQILQKKCQNGGCNCIASR